jgi:hypothetical protein
MNLSFGMTDEQTTLAAVAALSNLGLEAGAGTNRAAAPYVLIVKDVPADLGLEVQEAVLNVDPAAVPLPSGKTVK